MIEFFYNKRYLFALKLFIILKLILIISTPETLGHEKNKNKLHYKINNSNTVSFQIFENEFLSTSSLKEYHKSLLKLKENYNITISNKDLRDIHKKIDPNLEKKIKKLVTKLIDSIWKKTHFKNNNTYQILDKILNLSLKPNLAGRVELLLVEQEKKFGSKLVIHSKNRFDYFFYILKHCRYEVLIKMLSKFRSNSTKNLL